MVVSEPDEPLLLYIAATLEAVSMVLVAERPDPHDLHELESSSVDRSGSQDPGPAEELGAAVGSGSSDPGAADGSQSPEVAMGPLIRESHGPQVQSSHQVQRTGSSLGLH
jgi:hypothetical protein